jgi:hypothetical protein
VLGCPRDAGVLDGIEVGLGAAVDVIEPVSEKVPQLVEERLIARPLMPVATARP